MTVEGQDITDAAEAAETSRDAAAWLAEIGMAGRREIQWRMDASSIWSRYTGEAARAYEATSSKRLNLLFSNTETLLASLTPQLGNPNVSRLFPKPGEDDKASRAASLIMERGLIAEANTGGDEDDEFADGVKDSLVTGRGVVWLEFDADIDEDDVIKGQSARLVLVPWSDFRHGAAKRWRDVPWVARRELYSKEDLCDLAEDLGLAEDAFDDVPLTYSVAAGETQSALEETYLDPSMHHRAAVWELWDKREKVRVYLAEGFDKPLRQDDDPYGVQGFFPCAKPLYGPSKPTDSLLPRPEYFQYKDQADELDEVSDRLALLTDEMRYCGAYNGGSPDAEKLARLGELADGEFVPVRDFQSLSGGAGVSGSIWVRPIDTIAGCIAQLETRCDRIVARIYEITGISDIIRGVTDPREALGTQRIKSQFGSLRLQKRQKTVQKWVRESLRLKAEVIAEHFTREKLEECTGVSLPLAAVQAQAKQMLQQIGANPQLAQAIPPAAIEQMKAIVEASSWESVEAILRSDERRAHKVDVETDATALEDDIEDKKARAEYLQTVQGLLQVAGAAIAQNPDLAPLYKGMMGLASRGFKVGRALEQALEDSIDAIAAHAKQAGAQPNPMMQLEQMKLQIAQKGAETEAARVEIDKMKLQLEAQKLQNAPNVEGIKAQATASKAQAEIQSHTLDVMGKRMDLEAKARELDIKERGHLQGLQHKAQAHATTQAIKSVQANKAPHVDIS